MGKKADKKGKAPATTYAVRRMPAMGAQGRLAVIEIKGRVETIIARYQTMGTAQWVRRVMEDALKA